MDISDIVGCIGEDIEIGTRPVDTGLSNLGRVTGTATEDNGSGESVKKSQNILIAMLEELVSKKDAAEKKRILADEYTEAESSVYASL